MNTSRRKFLLTSAAGLVVSHNANLIRAMMQEKKASELIAGKDPRLIVLKPFPAVLETPLKLLAENQQTPASLLFVRNNEQPQETATLEPSEHKTWQVSIAGEVSNSATASLKQLRELPATSYEMVLQCSGNGRFLFSKASETSGTQWGRGGMGNVTFSGPLLSKVLDDLNIEVKSSGRFVNANGADEKSEGKEDFLHSLPVDDVLNRSILALEMNGSPLPAVHGGPVRLVTPGIFGTMQVKWLSELVFVTEESTNYNHVPRYRVPNHPIKPGQEYEYTLESSRFNWDMKVKSVLLTPNDGDRLEAGNCRIQGVAFNDGAAPISSVIVSLNKGRSWKRATLEHPDGKYGWTRFELSAELKRGRQEIWCRATDKLGRSQPDDGSVAWNHRGYEWNGVEKISVDVA